MVIHLVPPLPTVSSSQPGSTDGQSLTLPYLALLLVGFTWHPASPSDPVSSYLTLSPLPAFAKAPAGGLLSVALSLGSPPLDVIQHHALWSPDFPLPLKRERPSVLLRPNFIYGSRFKVPGIRSCSTSNLSNVEPPLTLFFLAQYQYPLTMGTDNQLIPPEKGVVKLRWQLHITAET